LAGAQVIRAPRAKAQSDSRRTQKSAHV
jgi:hypothetical protein